MIKFIKTPHHFTAVNDPTDGITIEINTEGQTLGEIADSFARFLQALGFDYAAEVMDDEEMEIEVELDE